MHLLVLPSRVSDETLECICPDIVSVRLVWQAEDQARKQGLHIMLQIQLEAAVAAALAGKRSKTTAPCYETIHDRRFGNVIDGK